MQDGAPECSEYAICENFIYPLLKEVWKQYRKNFVLWSHKYLNYDENLSGFPEYILAQKSPLGNIVFSKPFFVLIEAKQDNFESGWAQCLAEMIAAQKINVNANQEVFGITSNGEVWQFGKLKNGSIHFWQKPVIPVKTGIQDIFNYFLKSFWIPAYAGMTRIIAF
jgi:hypothetical protein